MFTHYVSRVSYWLSVSQILLIDAFGRFCVCVCVCVLIFIYLAVSGLSCSMWDLRFSTRHETHMPYIARWILNH